MSELAKPTKVHRGFFEQAGHFLDRFLRIADARRRRWQAAVSVLAAGLIVCVTSYWYLGMPGTLIESLVARLVNGDCAYDEPFWCGILLSTYSVLGSVIVMAIMFILRRQIRKGLKQLGGRLPDHMQFLVAPTVAAIIFSMSWAAVEFHFFTRPGIIFDGLFPAIIGTATFLTIAWSPVIQDKYGPLLARKDRLGKWPRLGIAAAIPIVVSLIVSPVLHSPIRDQLVAVVGIAGAWIVMLPAKGDGQAEMAKVMDMGAKASVVTLIALVALIPHASALDHCEAQGWFTEDIRACEVAHHTAAMGSWSGLIAVATAILTAVLTRPDPDDLPAPPRDPDAPHGRTPDGWPLGPDGQPVPPDWEGEPMIVAGPDEYVDSEGNVIDEGMVWYVDPDGDGHWMPRAEAEATVRGEVEAAQAAERINDDFRTSVWGDYERRKDEWARHVRERDAAEAAEGRAARDRLRTGQERIDQRDEALADLEAAERAQDAAHAGASGWDIAYETAEGAWRDTTEVVSVETVRIIVTGTAEVVATVAREATDPDNWYTLADGAAHTVADAARAATGDREVLSRTADNLRRGATAVARVGGHMVTHPVETASAVLGVDNWAAALDPDVPPRERIARVLYGAADATMTFGTGIIGIGDKINDLRRARDAIRVAEGVDNMTAAERVLRETAEALYEPKPGGAVWTTNVPRGADAATSARAAAAAQGVEDMTAAQRAVQAAEEAGDAAALRAARSRLRDAERIAQQNQAVAGSRVARASADAGDARAAVAAAEDAGDAAALARAQERLQDAERTLDQARDGARATGASDEAIEAAAKQADEARAAQRAEGTATEALDAPKGPDADFDARHQAWLDDQAAATAKVDRFQEANQNIERLRKRGASAADIRKAEDELLRATMDVQRHKGALSQLKAADDGLKGAFNQSLRGNVYDKVDADVVRWAEQRFGVGKTKYVGEAQPGMHVYVNNQTGERIMIFEPTNPKPGISVGADRDFVARVGKMEDGKLVMRDAPSHEVRAVYERSFYEHSGAARFHPTEGVDEVMSAADQMITDAVHREAYTRSPSGFDTVIRSPETGIVDADQIAGVFTDKSNHWYNEALKRPDRYEEMMNEGMRQSTKQWGNQVQPRISALRAQGVDVSVPKNLDQAMQAMGSGKSPAQIEQALAKIKGPGGTPYTPRTASQHAGEFWGAMEQMRPPAPSKLPSMSPRLVAGLASQAPAAQEARQ